MNKDNFKDEDFKNLSFADLSVVKINPVPTKDWYKIAKDETIKITKELESGRALNEFRRANQGRETGKIFVTSVEEYVNGNPEWYEIGDLVPEPIKVAVCGQGTVLANEIEKLCDCISKMKSVYDVKDYSEYTKGKRKPKSYENKKWFDRRW